MFDSSSKINIGNVPGRNLGRVNSGASKKAEGTLSEALDLIGSVQDEFKAKFSGDLILAALSDKDLTKLSKLFDKQYEKLHQVTVKLPEILEEQSGMISVGQAIQNSTSIPKAALNILAGLASSHPSEAVRQAAGKAIPDVTRILRKFIEILLKLGDISYAQELTKFIKTVTATIENKEEGGLTEGSSDFEGINDNFTSEDSSNENQELTTQILSNGFEEIGKTYGADSQSGLNNEIEDAISSLTPNKNKKNKTIAQA